MISSFLKRMRDVREARLNGIFRLHYDSLIYEGQRRRGYIANAVHVQYGLKLCIRYS